MNLIGYFTHLLPLIPALIIARILMNLPRRHFRGTTTLVHEVGVVALWLYIAAVISVTTNIPGILRGYWNFTGRYNITPVVGMLRMLQNGDISYTALNIIGNIVMFMPLGLLLPLLWDRWTIIHVLFIALILSIFIEVLQLFTSRGTDIDDVILNTLGCAAGYFIFWIVRRFVPRITNAFLAHKQV